MGEWSSESIVLEEILRIVKEYEGECLVCQERYGSDYMDRIASVLREYGYLGPKPKIRIVKDFEDFVRRSV